jgi:hypothetical protein
MAEPILYTIEFVASGSVGGVPFSNEPLVFAGVTDSGTVAAIAQANLAQLQQLIGWLSYIAGPGFRRRRDRQVQNAQGQLRV